MTAEHPPAQHPQENSAKREQQALQKVTNRLQESFADAYTHDQVTQTVNDVHHRFDGKPIRDFVPILVERMARERLRISDQ
ncbi:three-helix bundle dimerization domain-containing protein [Spirillospora sp. CA-142024]|uniref:three-helix bundle dimerization domain-containing protein n=1 Tax=Spirillospora sp. CA-142024 TaxID=3240036 RepID=UPI003D8FBADB